MDHRVLAGDDRPQYQLSPATRGSIKHLLPNFGTSSVGYFNWYRSERSKDRDAASDDRTAIVTVRHAMNVDVTGLLAAG